VENVLFKKRTKNSCPAGLQRVESTIGFKEKKLKTISIFLEGSKNLSCAYLWGKVLYWNVFY
jgi:hypothetical protein